MRQLRRRNAPSALGVAPSAALPGQATPVTDTYHFTASGFGSGAPLDPVSGSLTRSFDPTLTIAGASVESISLDIADHEYTTANTAFGFNGLDVFGGGTLNGTAVRPGTDDFFLEGLVHARRVYLRPQLHCGSAGSSAVFAARDVSVTTAVPEPPTLWLAALGVAMLGALRLRPSQPERR